MDEKIWEDTCRRCGQCCFEKWIDEDEVVRYTRIACRHLDIVTRECRVYHKRFEVGEGCIKLTPDIVRNAAWLPQDCSYRSFAGGTAISGDAEEAPSCSSSSRLLSAPSPPE